MREAALSRLGTTGAKCPRRDSVWKVAGVREIRAEVKGVVIRGYRNVGCFKDCRLCSEHVGEPPQV